jgi:hypothetical protein
MTLSDLDRVFGAIATAAEAPETKPAAMLAGVEEKTVSPQAERWHGFTLADLLQRADPEDVAELKASPGLCEAFASLLRISNTRAKGQRPDHYTQKVLCDGCGPVWLWEGSPGRVLGHNRGVGRPIPRPLVTCGTCRHFRRIDHPHLGHCAEGEPEAIAGLWDTDRRGCSRWLPLEQNTGDEVHGD